MRPEHVATINRELGSDGSRVKDGGNLPKLAQAQKIRRLAEVCAGAGGVDNESYCATIASVLSQEFAVDMW